MADETPRSEIILYLSEDGSARMQSRFENQTLWLTQALRSIHSADRLGQRP